MPIRKLAAPAAYTPEELVHLTAAFDAACQVLGVSRTQTVEAERVAMKILQCAQLGERDPDRLRDYAVHALRG
jgi:hypothetical protein